MSNKGKGSLLSILDAIDKNLSYVQGMTSLEQYHRNSLVVDATLMNFVVIGEMVDRISTDLRAAHSEIDWQKVKDFRNLAAHDYLGIDAEEVWQIIQLHLPELKTGIQAILAGLPS